MGHVLWASHDHVREAWVLVGPREGQEAGPFLQCCLCLPQPHHLQSPEQGCKEGLSESAWPQRDSSITQGVSELSRIMGRLDGLHVVSWKYISSDQLEPFYVYEICRKGEATHTLKFSPCSAATAQPISWVLKAKVFFYNDYVLMVQGHYFIVFPEFSPMQVYISSIQSQSNV